jgi:hypothetical protein
LDERAHAPAFVAEHDARSSAQTRGRAAMEGGDEQAGVKSVISSRSSLARRIKR